MLDPDIFLSLGSNLGDRAELLKLCRVQIDAQVGRILQTSSLYETAPWGNLAQPYYLNQVLRIETALEPLSLLAKILAIENELGRERQVRWEARTIDIDTLYLGSRVVSEPQLTVPHPRLAERRFVLEPLVEISPSFVHPVLGKTNKELLDACQDGLPVQLFKG